MSNINITPFYSKGYENAEVKTISSIEVAEMMGKEHKALLKDINGGGNTIGLIPTLIGANFEPNKYFIESSYTDSRNREQKCYLVTKMGCFYFCIFITF